MSIFNFVFLKLFSKYSTSNNFNNSVYVGGLRFWFMRICWGYEFNVLSRIVLYVFVTKYIKRIKIKAL